MVNRQCLPGCVQATTGMDGKSWLSASLLTYPLDSVGGHFGHSTSTVPCDPPKLSQPLTLEVQKQVRNGEANLVYEPNLVHSYVSLCQPKQHG